MTDWPSTWTDLTFGSTSSAYGRTVYQANESFTGAVGKMVEVEALVYATDAAEAAVGIGTGSKGVVVVAQADGNIVAYHYNTSQAVGGASGASTSWDYTGMYRMRIQAVIESATSIPYCGSANFMEAPSPQNAGVSMATLTGVSFVGSLIPFIQTTDLSKCYARARLIG